MELMHAESPNPAILTSISLVYRPDPYTLEHPVVWDRILLD